MLVNKSNKTVVIRYNQISIEVKEGKNLDVREFGIPAESVLAVERHILLKNPNVFDQKKTKDVIETNKEALAKIEELEKENADVKEKLLAQEKASKGFSEEAAKIKAENEGLTTQVTALTKDVKALQAQVKAGK